MVEDTEETCWRRRTPYQTAYILVLCVAVPFLIIFIFTYIMFLTVWNQSEKCSRLCALQPNKRYKASGDKVFYDSGFGPKGLKADLGPPDFKIPNLNDYDYWKKFYKKIGPMVWYPKTKTKRAGVDVNHDEELEENANEETVESTYYDEENDDQNDEEYEDNENTLPFPAAATILQDLYVDDDQEQTVLCPSVSLSDTVLLSTYTCMKDYLDNFSSLLVRARSAQWSQDGLTTNIKNIRRNKNLTAIYLESALEDDVNVTIPEYLNSTLPAMALIWTGNLALPMTARKKFTGMIPENVTLYNGTLGRGNFTNTQCAEGSPILNHDQTYLYGFITQCRGEFFDVVNISNYRDWLI